MKTYKKASSIDKLPADMDMAFLQSALGYHIRLANIPINRKFKALISMTSSQFSLLSLIVYNPGLPQVSLGRALDMGTASTMAMIDRLEALGLVERRRSDVDGRYWALHATPKGMRKHRVWEKKIKDEEDRVHAKFSEAELKAFVEYLNRWAEA